MSIRATSCRVMLTHGLRRRPKPASLFHARPTRKWPTLHAPTGHPEPKPPVGAPSRPLMWSPQRRGLQGRTRPKGVETDRQRDRRWWPPPWERHTDHDLHRGAALPARLEGVTSGGYRGDGDGEMQDQGSRERETGREVDVDGC